MSNKENLKNKFLETGNVLNSAKDRKINYSEAIQNLTKENSNLTKEKLSSNSQKKPTTNTENQNIEKNTDSNFSVKEYESAVKLVWAYKRIHPEGMNKLKELSRQLQLPENKRAEIERKIMGRTKEEIVFLQNQKQQKAEEQFKKSSAQQSKIQESHSNNDVKIDEKSLTYHLGHTINAFIIFFVLLMGLLALKDSVMDVGPAIGFLLPLTISVWYLLSYCGKNWTFWTVTATIIVCLYKFN